MKLKIDKTRTQPDPYIFEDNGKLYLYCTAESGVEAYTADSLFGEWSFAGVVTDFSVKGKHYWAPSVIRLGDTYYMYVSYEHPEHPQYLFVARSQNPLGPFTDEKMLYNEFSIDSHIVQNESGLYLWYAKDHWGPKRQGTRIYIDKMLDPYTPANEPREMVVPTYDEERYMKNRFGDGKDWFTLEGPFYFYKDGYHYLMYSGGCFGNETYHIGYAVAKSKAKDLTKINLVKHTKKGAFAPVLLGNEIEEGTGHHSVIFYQGEYYAVYHARDIDKDDSRTGDENFFASERRTARVCKLHVKGGTITAERL